MKQKPAYAMIAALLLACCLSACDKGDGNGEAAHDLSIKEGNARATGSASNVFPFTSRS